ncbi:MAG TPA: PTS sugar transporter subunit IIA [Candidatus Hydrogenedentes bacterium]|nr:PTS sugar transporter subunit IIA [Candidatus Hydrogenedentota bacterium]HRK35892.1 PTS sugar transporter subunit IIA [Candidatus Hydrogenedentota bacterium]
MRLGDLLHENTIKLNLEALDKQAAIEELVDVLVQSHEIPFSLRNHVLEIIREREAEVSTGFEHGVAVPHGASDRVDDTIVALGTCKQGIPFESVDGISARIIVLAVFPRRSFTGNVNEMAAISHLLSNATLRDKVRAANSAAEVLKAIREEEGKDAFYQHLKK